jgi:GGDEF domain-containing protein
MLKLKDFLSASEGEHALRKVVSVLLEKIGTVAVRGDPAEHTEFRAEMNHLRDQAENEVSPERLFVTAGAAVQAMENYNLRIAALIRKQSAELQSVVAMITETAAKIGGENARSVQRLHEIANKFEHAGTFEDLRALKSHLADCLLSFREEMARQRAESDMAIRSLQNELQRRPIAGGAVAMDELDPVTGLFRQGAGLQAMRAATESGKRLYVVATVVKGVQSVNARFGFEVGDRMLRAFKNKMEHHLLHADRMFRWDGPAIVILMDRVEPISQVRTQIRRMLDSHIDESFDVDGRSVLIPITAEWLAFPLLPPVSLAGRQIQSFIAGQAPAATVAG